MTPNVPTRLRFFGTWRRCVRGEVYRLRSPRGATPACERTLQTGSTLNSCRCWSTNAISEAGLVELGREETPTRSSASSSPPKLEHLSLELGDPLPVLCRGAGSAAGVDLGLL